MLTDTVIITFVALVVIAAVVNLKLINRLK